MPPPTNNRRNGGVGRCRGGEKDGGGVGKFMNYTGPTWTDSGGFQVFSLGSAFGQHVSKFAAKSLEPGSSEHSGKQNALGEKEKKVKSSKDSRFMAEENIGQGQLAKVTEEGTEFRSHIDGSKHFFTPERSMEIQHNIGADMMFAFDECTSPNDSEEYLREAMERTHRWALRCLDYHHGTGKHHSQGLFGIVQGGNNEKLRKESAKVIGGMDFDGFGIGGSFTKEDLDNALVWVNSILPEEKPRHLLGIGEPIDLFIGVENGIDTFDCVAPTRMARNGTLYTRDGRVNILNSSYKNDFTSLSEWCPYFEGTTYTRAYLAHLFRSKEMLAGTLASIINLQFIIGLVDDMREAILEGSFQVFKDSTISRYYI